MIKQLAMPSSELASDEAFDKYINRLRVKRAENKSEEEKKRLETYKDRVMIRKLKQLDSKLKHVDFDIYIEVQKVGCNVTGNHNFYELRNQRLMEVGILN